MPDLVADYCDDGILDEWEEKNDCGWPCDACPTCDDGLQNQEEEDVDCGGPCTACPTCEDGIKNQEETGIDCGGPCAKPCQGMNNISQRYAYLKEILICVFFL